MGALGACAGPPPAEVPDDQLRGRIPPPGDVRSTRVVRVVDGDTVVLADLGSSRLIGVDTPEVHGGEECFGTQASAFARRVLARGSLVRFLPGREPRDRYGRPLVYLWLADGRSLNAMLVEGGYAKPLAIEPNDRYAKRFANLDRRARTSGRGRWAACAGG